MFDPTPPCASKTHHPTREAAHGAANKLNLQRGRRVRWQVKGCTLHGGFILTQRASIPHRHQARRRYATA